MQALVTHDDWLYLTGQDNKDSISGKYVKIRLPQIKWVKDNVYNYIINVYLDDIKTDIRIAGYQIQGTIPKFDECDLHKGDYVIFAGNLEDCKQKVNDLIWHLQ